MFNSGNKKYSITADLHCDTVLQMIRGYDISKRHENYHIDIPRLKDGGVDLQVFASLANPFVDGKSEFEMVNLYIDCLKSEIRKNSDDICICHTSSEAVQAKENNKIAAVLAIEGGTALESEPNNIEYFYNKSIRLLTLVHEQSTNWCISWSDPKPAFNGITELGKEIIGEMNRLGMIIDISHCTASSADEAIVISTSPVIASHSCVDSICPIGRNLKDNQIKAIADSGGVIGVTFVYAFLSAELKQQSTSFRQEHKQQIRKISELFCSIMPEDKLQAELKMHASFMSELETPSNPLIPTVKTVVNHINHIIKIGGIECVAIGSDFDGMSMPPLGLEDCTGMPNIIKELLAHGYKESEIENIMGRNFMRVFKDVCR